MRTIERHIEINRLLNDIDLAATDAINRGLKFTVEWRDDGVTEKQFKASHVWFKWCADYLNSIGVYRCAPTGRKMIPWTQSAFKEDVYKPVLKIWKGKDSTKKQNTVDPNEIVLAISGHLATAYKKNIKLPEWPSNR